MRFTQENFDATCEACAEGQAGCEEGDQGRDTHEEGGQEDANGVADQNVRKAEAGKHEERPHNHQQK